MVRNVGSDIIEIARIKKAWDRHGDRFLNKIFTSNEQKYCLTKKAFPERHLAGRFAGKEALAKALGTGFGPISWLDLEIVNDAHGKPYVIPSLHLLEAFNNPRFLITISHCHDYAMATALLL